MTARQYFEEKIPELLKRREDVISSIDAVYEFQITGDQGGTWTLNLKQNDPTIEEKSAAEPDCTVIMEDKEFVKMVEGELKAQMAFLTGKLKVTGNMGLALKLTALFN